MINKNLQGNAEVTEFLTADEQKITELVGGLEKVSAPNDFEFRLKARIAARKDNGYQTGYWQWLRYLLPVGASAFVLAFVLYATNFFAPSQSSGEQRADLEPTKQAAEVVNKPIETQSNTLVAVANSNNAALAVNSSDQQNLLPKTTEKEPILIADKPDSKNTEPQPKTTPEDNFNGTKVLSSKPSDVNILPRGIETNKTIPKPQEFKDSGKVEMAEMLNINGIETISEGGKLKVNSIKQNSPAERAGVKTGDIIESFDEQKTNGNNNSSNLGGVRKLTVSRDGKIMTFDLKLD